jgi:SAM-dependent methyltransferase
MINSVLKKEELSKYWYESYLYFMEERSLIDKDCDGWLFWAKTRVGGCSSILEFIDFSAAKRWKVLELGARGSAFSSYLSLFDLDIIVSDNFQVGQNDGHIWNDWDKKSTFGDLDKWDKRWKKIAPFPEKIKSEQMDSRFIPYPNNYFDCIVSISVIEHIKNKQGFSGEEDLVAMKEACRVLKPDGRFGITTDFDKVGKDEQNRPKLYDENSFVELVNKSGFMFERKIYNYKTEEPIGGFAILRK